MAEPYDCSKCGACCVDQLLLLHTDDQVPLHMKEPMQLTEGYRMRLVNGRCAAFRGRLGIDASCSIYDQRPDICRVMAPGSWACKDIRLEWNIA